MSSRIASTSLPNPLNNSPPLVPQPGDRPACHFRLERDPLGSMSAGSTGFPSRAFLWKQFAHNSSRLCPEERSPVLLSGLRWLDVEEVFPPCMCDICDSLPRSLLPCLGCLRTFHPLTRFKQDSPTDEFKTTQHRNNPEVKSKPKFPAMYKGSCLCGGQRQRADRLVQVFIAMYEVSPAILLKATVYY